VSHLLGAGVTSPSNSNSSPQYHTVSTSPSFDISDPLDHIDESTITESQDTGNTVGEVTTDKLNVILPWLPLLQFMSQSFCCGVCKQTISISNFEKVQASFATSLNLFCTGCNVDSVKAETRTVLGANKLTHKTDAEAAPNQYAVHHLHDDYALNQKMIMALQQVGSGRAGGAVLGGLLSIFVDPMKNQWTDIETSIGKAEIGLGEDILEANIKEEKSLSGKDKEGRSKLCVSVDAGWNNQASGILTSFDYVIEE
jgi:hypothetical protein